MMLRRLGETIGYVAMVIGNLGCRFFPRRVAYVVTDYLMVLFYFIYKESRKTMLANTEYVLRFSGDKSDGREFGPFGFGSRKLFREEVRFPGDAIRECIKQVANALVRLSELAP